jgi:hypothetical protein
MNSRTALAYLCVLGLSALGCSSKETTSSCNIKTGGIAAQIDVYADDDTSATVHDELKIAGSNSNAFTLLECGDELTATAGDVTKTLTARDEGIYEATFSGVEADTEFSVTLERPDDVTASGNSGSLPAPFALDKPAATSRMEDLKITWAPESDDRMELEADGDCTKTFRDDDVPDTGSYTIAAGELESFDEDKPETCNATLDARRVRGGKVDSKFDPESHFNLFQRRSVKFVTDP